MINTRGLFLLFFVVSAILPAGGCTSNRFKQQIREREEEKAFSRAPIVVEIVARPDQLEQPRLDTKGVFFEFNSSALSADAKKTLELRAKEIINNNWDKVVIVGHTDNVGSRKVNRALSEARAKSVAAFLISKGVNPDIIQTVSAFYLWPVADNKTDKGRAKNRRADISIR